MNWVKFRRRVEIVEARQNETGEAYGVTTRTGLQMCGPNDWEVRLPSGLSKVMRTAELERLYERDY